MQRFYVTGELTDIIELSDVIIHHQVTRVLRAKPGDYIVLFNGDGSEREFEVREITKKTLKFHGWTQRNPQTEWKIALSLFQALPNKMEKIEYILEKWVEVGIRRFVFFRSDFSQKLILSDAKKQRFHTIAKEALEQCGWLIMPEIEFRDSFPHDERGDQNKLLDTTGAIMKLTEMPQKDMIHLWVGPEGGWSESERKKMKENGFIFVRFWERIMRTETAGIVTAFSLLHL